MKELLVLRHAKSSWKDGALRDHDRPLNKRGRRAAPRLGVLLAEHGLLPDHVVSSTAVRARTTAEAVTAAAGYDGEIELQASLYHADVGTILAVVAGTSEAVERLLWVGHNPGCEEVVAHLTGAQERFPTAALAHLELDLERWDEAPAAAGRLLGLWRPRELD